MGSVLLYGFGGDAGAAGRADPPLRTLVLDLEGVSFIDAQAAAKLTAIEELTDAEGISLRLARVKPNVRTVLQADELIERIGKLGQ